MSGARVTSVEVALRAGVSQSAVSRVFTPGASASEDTRRKVLEAAEALGYRPNALARSLIAGRSRIIGVVMSYLANQFYPDVLQELSTRLQAEGFHLLLFTVPDDAPPDRLVQQAMDYQVDGLILASVSLSSDLAGEAVGAGIPVVMFNRTSEIAAASAVTGDNVAGGARSAAFLVAGGHRRIAFVAGAEATSTNRDRERGFRAALARHGVELARREIGGYSFVQAKDAARRLFGSGERPDAVFCANDHMAIAVLETARHEFGLKIPDDVSIVGFDDVGPARWPSYSITSYQQPVGAMVDACVTALLDRMDNEVDVARRVVVPGELVVRRSARQPPGVIQLNGQTIWRESAG
jgi:DNA-binding LacI/PurR family transcriptional regulator